MVPFLKWVGGKRQLLADIRKFIPDFTGRYIEPFLGGGAVYFDLEAKQSWINDINPELVNCYEVVRDDVAGLIKHLQHHKYEKSYFMSQRSLDRQDGGLDNLTKLERASRFIYLNKTGFNGMYRVNSKGFFNVPMGRYKDPKIVNADILNQASKILKTANISNLQFSEVLQHCHRDDFVYVDPPYIPVSPTANFTQYSEGAFGLKQQQQLASELRDLHKRGVKFLASNAHADLVYDLYDGFKIELVHAKRSINSKASARQAVQEVLITNI